jgi:hypothetical protein
VSPVVSSMYCVRLMEYAWIQVLMGCLMRVQGLYKRKNKFPVGGVMVMLFVPSAVLTE